MLLKLSLLFNMIFLCKRLKLNHVLTTYIITMIQ
jgi:hypothetical protein